MKTLTNLIVMMLFALVISGCTKIEYLPCPEIPMKTKAPLLNFKGTGDLYKLVPSRGDYFVWKKSKRDINETSWVATNRMVKRVKVFEKSCYQRNADYISTVKAINAFNAEIDE